MKNELTDRELSFYTLFEQLVSAMTDFDNINISLIKDIIAKLCRLLRISKAVTRLYRNVREEAEGAGETIDCILSDEPSSIVMSKRVVTSVMTIATLTIYKADSEPELDDFERKSAELVLNTVLSFVSRNRLKDIVAELALFDDSGFKNQRSFRNYLRLLSVKGILDGRAAVNYNLRHFALVNQKIGRENGTRVMKKHYESLEKLIGNRGIVCRLGGDNFVAVFGAEQLDDVVSFLTETRVVYDETEGSAADVSTSAGIFVFPEKYSVNSSNEIMGCIVNAFRAAQSGGNERIVFFSEKLMEGREKSKRVQQLFPKALRNEEFKVFYQPKVDVYTGELTGAEALCRWFSDGKIVPPIDFIPALEETNDICRLDMYMLSHVCRDIRRWLDEGKKAVRISVNLSRKHIMNSMLLDEIMEIISENGIPHEYIEIELTETTTEVEFEALKRVVGGLQSSGVYTSVDDFGIGYSSLNLIREIPWNVLKVDKSFLPGENNDIGNKSGIMFKHVIAMARDMGLECIAEGVETLDQLELLKDNGCGIAQGFLFDKPLPVEEFEKRLEKHSYTI